MMVNLLDLNVEERLARDPMALERDVLALPKRVTHVVLDEIQKLPRLLDVVHNLMETHHVPQSFILTCSSARKLKAGGANLLAGRATLRHLYPLTSQELGKTFVVDDAVRWGTLPSIWNTKDIDARHDILRSYANTYLKEEVWGEQLVRQLDPFRRFLEVAAANSGKVLNFSNVARDAGVDVKTVQAWYMILEDTLIGFFVDAYHSSIRKQLRQAPKFYFFDTGVTRALAQMLNVVPAPRTSYYGDLFEQHVICELRSRNQYESLDYKFNYLLTKTDVEIDLIVTRPGKPMALVEIKSTTQVKDDHLASLNHFAKDFPKADLFLWSQDPHPQRFGRVNAVPWQKGIASI
jgi:predicted AAA+ superfamily ATPase